MRLFDLKSIQFSQIFTEINNYLAKSTGSVKSINKSTVFGQLMTVVAGVAHNIMMYIEDSLVEQNKYTAQRKKSVLGLAAQSGYQPSYGKAAGCWVRIAHKPNNRTPLDVVIPEHQQILCSKNGLYYNLVLNKSAVTIKCDEVLANEYFYAVQGQFETQRFVVPGGPLYVQNFKFVGYLDTDYISVKVNGEPWVKKDSLYDMGANESSYCTDYNPINGIDLIFGDGINGAQLADGDIIEVSYLLHDGESGNVATEDSIFFLFGSNLHDISGQEVDGNTCFNINFATTDAVASGSDPETIKKIRQMIGYNTRSMVLSDSNAYAALLNKYSFVGYNRTWSEPGSMIVHSMVMRNYKQSMQNGLDYFKLKPEQFFLSDIQKTSIQNAIIQSNLMLAGTTYDIVDIELCKYALYLYVKMKDSTTDREIVSTKIRKLIGEFFGEVKSDCYIPKSDIINLIKEHVEEVDGVNCYFLSERNELALQTRMYEDKQYIYDPATGTYKEKKVTVKLLPFENPHLGLDSHGNILIESDLQFPVLMGGWDFQNKLGQEVTVTDPLNIIFE